MLCLWLKMMALQEPQLLRTMKMRPCCGGLSILGMTPHGAAETFGSTQARKQSVFQCAQWRVSAERIIKHILAKNCSSASGVPQM